MVITRGAARYVPRCSLLHTLRELSQNALNGGGGESVQGEQQDVADEEVEDDPMNTIDAPTLDNYAK